MQAPGTLNILPDRVFCKVNGTPAKTPMELLMKNTGFSLKKEGGRTKNKKTVVFFFSHYKEVFILGKATHPRWWVLGF